MKIKNFNEIYENMIRQKNPMVDKLQRNKQISTGATVNFLRRRQPCKANT